MRNEADLSRAPRKIKELYVVKRLALQDVSTIHGVLGRWIDNYEHAQLRFFVMSAADLLGGWNSPFPTTVRLLKLSADFAEAAAVEDLSALVSEVLRHLSGTLRILAVTADPQDAASKLHSRHSALLSRLRGLVGDQRWADTFRNARAKSAQKVVDDLLPVKVDKPRKPRYEAARGQRERA